MGNTSSINDKELIIDLDKLNSTQSLGAEEYIRKDIIIDIVDKIDRTVKNNIDNIGRRGYSSNSASLPIAQHPCFFIHGERGSGKSTLLRGIIEALNTNDILGFPRSNPQKIELLTYVDPTEFAKGENFFIYILSKIADRLKEQKKTSAHAYDSPYSFQDKRKEKHKKIIELFQDMAEGLKFIQDTKESLHKSEDAAFFFEDYVSKCSSSAQLKHKFAELMEEMSELEHVDAYVVAIDDADINFGKCSEIMETVRKYMTTPRLVILFAGDMRLYSIVARDTHFDYFNGNALTHDKTRVNHRRTILDQLEDQYILKLFPVNNRVYLQNFEGILKRSSHNKTTLRYSYISKDKIETRSLDLNIFTNKFIQTLVPLEFHYLVENLFCSQSLRSMLHLIDYWIKNAYVTNEEIDYHELAKGILMIFSQVLISNQINYTAINQGNFHILLKEIILHAARLEYNGENATLLSFNGDDSAQKISLYLNSALLSQLSDLAHQLRYIFYLHPLLHSLPSETRTKSEAITKLYNTSSIYNYSEWGGWCTALLWQTHSKEKQFCSGIILLKNETNAGYISVDTFIKNLCKRIRNKVFIYAIYHALSLVIKDDKSHYCLSIYNLITLMHEILNLKDPGDGSLDANIKRIIKVKTAFPTELLDSENRVFLYRTRGDSDADSADNIHISELHPYFEDYEKSSADIDQLVNDIKDWYTEAHKNTSSSTSPCYPQTLDLCWKEFYHKCLRCTESARIHSDDDSALARAGQLFKSYMDALTDTLKKKCPETKLHECINTFPLWNAFSQDEAHSLLDYLNAVNIGADAPSNADLIIPEYPKAGDVYLHLSMIDDCALIIIDRSKGIKIREKVVDKVSLAELKETRDRKDNIIQSANILMFSVNSILQHLTNLREMAKFGPIATDDLLSINTSISELSGKINTLREAIKELDKNNINAYRYKNATPAKIKEIENALSVILDTHKDLNSLIQQP